MLYDDKHKDEEGLNKILSYKASMGKGLSKTLLSKFPDIEPVERKLALPTKDFNPFLSSWFFDGEGCFYVKASKTKQDIKIIK